MDLIKFYIAQNENVMGPWAPGQIARRILDEELDLSDFVYLEDQQEWMPLESFELVTNILTRFEAPQPLEIIWSNPKPIRAGETSLIEIQMNKDHFPEDTVFDAPESLTITPIPSDNPRKLHLEVTGSVADAHEIRLVIPSLEHESTLTLEIAPGAPYQFVAPYVGEDSDEGLVFFLMDQFGNRIHHLAPQSHLN